MSTDLLDISSGKQLSRSLAVWGSFVVALLVSWAYSAHFLPSYIDDAFISYRYSERLLHGLGLTWNDGERVEGYSNLLWVLLVSAGGIVQNNLVLVGWTLGLLANAATLGALTWAFRPNPQSALFPLLGGLLVLSLSTAFAYWGVGGLETPLVEALLAWALAVTYRTPGGSEKWVGEGLLLGFLALCRVDGILFSFGICAGVILSDRTHGARKRAVRILILPVMFAAAQAGFRLWYYGGIIPNTAYVKLAFTPERLLGGSLYVGHAALSSLVPLATLAAIILILWRSRRRLPPGRTWIAVAPALLWMVYVNFIGGDHFEYYRHWMPVLVCLAFALSSVLTVAPRIAPYKHAAVLAVATGLYVVGQARVDPLALQYIPTPETQDLFSRGGKAFPAVATSDPLEPGRRAIEGCLEFGRFLHNAFGERRPLIAVINAGCIPYASQLPALDMLGLNDAYIAHHRPADMGRGLIAHETGDGAYVLARKPDLVAFCGPPSPTAGDPCFRGELELAATPEFHRNYRLVFFHTGSVIAAVWARIEDGRLGITRTYDRIRIPGFLLATQPGAHAVLDRDKPVAALETGGALVQNIYWPPGTWEVSLEADSGGTLELATSPPEGSTATGPRTLEISSTGGTRSFRVSGGRGFIYSITAKRVITPDPSSVDRLPGGLRRD